MVKYYPRSTFPSDFKGSSRSVGLDESRPHESAHIIATMKLVVIAIRLDSLFSETDYQKIVYFLTVYLTIP